MKKIILLTTLLCTMSLSVWAACIADLDMGGYKITNLKAPIADDDIVTKKYIDDILSTLKAENISGLYGTIRSGGKTWLDRNLGAQRVAQSQTDTLGYGDLYQWGRVADGHEDINSITTGTKADIPSHSFFITSTTDWRNTPDTGLWNTLGTGTNEVCPNGYRLPLMAEFTALGTLHNEVDFSNKIRITRAGYRINSTGDFNTVGTHGYYWTSEVNGDMSKNLQINPTASFFDNNNRASGFSVRCIKN